MIGPSEKAQSGIWQEFRLTKEEWETLIDDIQGWSHADVPGRAFLYTGNRRDAVLFMCGYLVGVYKEAKCTVSRNN